MKSLEVSRRRMLALVGASVVVVPAVASAAPGRRAVGSGADGRVAGRTTDGSALVAPLVAGSVLAVWTVRGISAIRHGALTVALSDGRGTEFYLDVCARDDGAGAYEPPARSDRFDVFVSNRGQGSDPTVEDQGLAAMALAEILRANENRVQCSGLLTLRSRLAQFPDEVVRGL